MTDKRTAILEAALELIAANGFHGAPTARIAEAAGVGVGTIYRYFRDKEELIHALFDHVGENARAAILEGHNPEAPIREQFVTLCNNTVHFLVDNPKVFAYIEQYFLSPYGVSKRRDILLNLDEPGRHLHPVDHLIAIGRRAQIIKDLPSVVINCLIFGPIIMLVRDICAGNIEFDAEGASRMVAACWDAVKR